MSNARWFTSVASWFGRIFGRAEHDAQPAKAQPASVGNPLEWRSAGLVPKDLASWIGTTKAEVEARAAAGVTADDYADPLDREIHRFFTEEWGEEEWAGHEFLVWSCTMDRQSCRRCRRHDGKIIPATKKFRHPPGEIHDGCRCVAVRLTVSDEQVRRMLPGLHADYQGFRKEFRSHRPDQYPAAEFVAGALKAEVRRGVHPARPELTDVILSIHASDPKASSSEYTALRMLEL